MSFMPDPLILLSIAAAALAAVVIVAATTLRGWHGWLEIRRLELASHARASPRSSASPATWIELADLKERVRKLEAIAAGVDL